MSWRPADRTYEVLTYRRREAWGTTRDVNEGDVALLDSRFPSTFNNFDAEAGRPAIVPRTTCPVLYGIRGDSAMHLVDAMRSVRSEEVDRWSLFISNQGTDDHVLRSGPLEANSSYEVSGTVASMPVTVQGGHVIAALDVGTEILDMAAYEPSKGFRDVVRSLRPGDFVTAVGELRQEPRALNLEKLELVSLASSRTKVANPRCPECGRAMKSIGSGAGYRCRACGTRAKEAVTEEEERLIATGWHEPPVCSRRHLSKPLCRTHDIGDRRRQ